jgi:hypothetical protein
MQARGRPYLLRRGIGVSCLQVFRLYARFGEKHERSGSNGLSKTNRSWLMGVTGGCVQSAVLVPGSAKQRVIKLTIQSARTNPIKHKKTAVNRGFFLNALAVILGGTSSPTPNGRPNAPARLTINLLLHDLIPFF